MGEQTSAAAPVMSYDISVGITYAMRLVAFGKSRRNTAIFVS